MGEGERRGGGREEDKAWINGGGEVKGTGREEGVGMGVGVVREMRGGGKRGETWVDKLGVEEGRGGGVGRPSRGSR